MKHPGSTMEYAQQRLADLLSAYDRHLAQCGYIRMDEVYAAIVEQPAPRFYVSDSRASKVIYAMLRGCPLPRLRPLKREMFQEILRRVLALRRRQPGWSISECCAVVVEQPAPKFYLAPGSAKVMICKARKQWIREKMKRLRIFT